MSRTWSPTKFADPGGGHSSAIVALWLAADQAETLAVAGGEPAESLHVTLLCIPDAASLSDIQVAHLLATCDNIAAFTPPVTGEITGMGRFYANDANGGQDVIFAIPSLPDVLGLRERLESELQWSRAEIEIADDFGFLPHITLAYVDPGAASPVDAIATIPLRFDALTVAIGEQQTTIPLRGWRDGEMCYADAAALGEGGHFFTEIQFTEPPEWLPLLPTPGDYLHPTWGTVEMSAERIDRLVASVNEKIYQDAIPVDAEHDLDVSGALGWFSQARVNADGSADVQVEWTERGKSMLADDRFRYVSPTLWSEWTDPATSAVHEDVVTGLALCTRPFFKSLSIDRAALVASERGADVPSLSLVRHDGEPVRFVASERADLPAPEVNPMSQPDAKPTDAKPTATAQEFSELKQQFADLSAKLTASEERANKADERATAAETRVTTLEQAKRRKEFTDEVLGRSDANDIRWFGDVESHVAILEALGDEPRQKYIEQQREQAKRLTAAMGKELGSDAPAGGGALAEVMAKAKKYREEHPGQSIEQAIVAVTEAEPGLARRYREEKAGK